MKPTVMDEQEAAPHPPARAQGQHERPVANPEFPHWGRDSMDHAHAIFAVANHLRSLKLEHWTAQVVRWLTNYDGFERWLDECHDPCVCVRDLLASYVVRWNPLRLQACTAADGADLQRRIVQDLLQLDFVRYRAYWGRDLVPNTAHRAWNPLLQSWLTFVESGQPGEELIVFEAHQTIVPPLDAHSQFLLQG